MVKKKKITIDLNWVERDELNVEFIYKGDLNERKKNYI